MSKKNPNVKGHPFSNAHFVSTFSMSLVLFLVGLISLMLFIGRDMTNYVRENINLSVILDDQASPQYVQRIERYLKSAPFVHSVDYISKQDALKDHIATMGENPEEFLGYNPLLASLEVKLNPDYANPDSVKVIERKLKTFDHINQVAYQKDMFSLVNDNVKKFSFILFGLTAVLLFISIALINNTIRLNIHSNRFLINTMKLVGATHWFIRRPYIARSMINGLIASVTGLLLLVCMVLIVQHEFGLGYTLVSPATAFMVSGVVILLGLLLSAVSAYFAVGRYLRMNSDDIYFV